MIRAVIDPNIVVSGLLTPRGNAALVLLGIRQGFIRPCVSDPVLDEYSAVLARPKFGFRAGDVAEALRMPRHEAEHAEPSASSFVSPAPADTKFIDCAVTWRADGIVTGNRRDFPDAPYGVTRVASAGEILQRLALELGADGRR